MDLGARPLQTFRFVTLPTLSTALVSGALLAFALSFDEVIVTTFTAGAQNTLPLWIFGAIRLGQQLPEVNAVVLAVVILTVVPVLLGALSLAGVAVPAAQAASLPCDIYAAASTPCVAAHSTVRALFASYNGPLYQVKRASDGATTNISTLSAGGYANAAAQDSFCAGTTCTIR